MGQHADDFLNMCIDHDSVCDDYASGNMSLEDAYEHGLIDENGCEIDPSLKLAYERYSFPTPENIHNELSHALKDLTIADLRTQHPRVYENIVDLLQENGCEKVIDCWGQETLLNEVASDNLYKEVPTCNHCLEDMTRRVGKFGKFYFCSNRCKDQGTVSDEYWQSVRKQ